MMALYRSTAAHDGAPGFADRTGQEITIIRPLGAQEADLDETGPMYRIRFADGTETDAFQDEIWIK